jgi:hypothetical protein
MSDQKQQQCLSGARDKKEAANADMSGRDNKDVNKGAEALGWAPLLEREPPKIDTSSNAKFTHIQLVENFLFDAKKKQAEINRNLREKKKMVSLNCSNKFSLNEFYSKLLLITTAILFQLETLKESIDFDQLQSKITNRHVQDLE